MKKLILLLILLPVCAYADQVAFEWDYPTNEQIDGFAIYSGPMRQLDSGAWQPDFSADPILADIDPASRAATVDNPGLPGIDHNFCYVIRAFRAGTESDNSNQVCGRINNAPLLAPIQLSGTYDMEQKEVSLSWEQTDNKRTSFWNVYYRIGDNPDFVELGRLDNLGQAEPTISRPLENVPDGMVSAVSFVVVAYKDYEVFSPNSAELTIYVDKRSQDVPPVSGFRFKIRIPVE